MLNQAVIPDVPLLERFPFPLKSDTYRYHNNSTSLNPPILIDITPEYFEEVQLKRELLENKREHTYQSLPYTLNAQWEIAEMLFYEMTIAYPHYFSLEIVGDKWHFQNHLLNEEETFRFGDETSLPVEPLDFIGRHIQEDLMFLAQREGDLYLAAAQLCFPGNWSLPFNLGRTFEELHEAVPTFTESGLNRKVRDFLMRIEAGKPWQRRNWTLTAGNILPTLPATFDEWGHMRNEVTHENVGEFVHMRVEDQKMFRLPESNGLLFSIHTHLLPMNELIKNREWTERFYRVLIDFPDDIASYKGYLPSKEKVANFLRNSLENS